MKEICVEQKSQEYSKAELYAALKLIEQLYIDGYIARHIYQNIHSEYVKDTLDIAG